MGFLHTPGRGTDVTDSRNRSDQQTFSNSFFDLAPLAWTRPSHLCSAASGTERSMDGPLCGNRFGRCRRTWGTRACHCGECGPRVEIGGQAALRCPSTLDVAHVHPVVLGRRNPADRRIGNGRAFRCRMALSTLDMDQLARAIADLRVQPVSATPTASVVELV